MPIGINGGGNLNVYLFEVGMITRATDGSEVVQLVGVHPLLVAPENISYTDPSSSPVVQTTGGALKTINGRGLRTVQMNGTFGVDSRGLGAYIGTGEVRFQRFYNEVVRLPESIDADDVNEAIDDLTGTPFIRQLLRGYDPERSYFYINFYDFFSQRRFACTLRGWSDSRHAMRGGASGLVHYQMTVQEEGPLVAGGLGTQILSDLFAGLTIWQDLNAVISSYTTGAVVDALLAPIGVLGSQISQTQQAFIDQAQAATGLVGGLVRSSDVAAAGLSTYFTTSARLADLSRRAAEDAAVVAPEGFDNQGGFIDWSEQPDEGFSAALEASEQIEDLEDLADAAAYQAAAGVLFGQDRQTYQTFVAGSGSGAVAANIAGSIQHTVGQSDSEATLEARFGVSFDELLDLNQLTPDEALLLGTVLTIPTTRNRGSQRIDGLPTFGSHVGRAAWGTDLRTDLAVLSGDFVVLSEEDVLQQGVAWLIEVFQARLLDLLNETPQVVRARLLELRLVELLRSDKRIAAVEQITVVDRADQAAMEIDVTMSAINGGLVRTSAGGV